MANDDLFMYGVWLRWKEWREIAHQHRHEPEPETEHRETEHFAHETAQSNVQRVWNDAAYARVRRFSVNFAEFSLFFWCRALCLFDYPCMCVSYPCTYGPNITRLNWPILCWLAIVCAHSRHLRRFSILKRKLSAQYCTLVPRVCIARTSLWTHI